MNLPPRASSLTKNIRLTRLESHAVLLNSWRLTNKVITCHRRTRNRWIHKLEILTVRVNTFDFSGKVALVTGGSRGIGRATALLFAQSGAKVVIGDVDPAGDETVEAIKRDGGEVIFVKTDVSDEGDVKNLIATAVKTYGGLHCAFNNAGVLPPTVMLVEMEESTFDQTLAVDLKGVFLCMKHEIAHMLQSGGGAIVNNCVNRRPDRRAGN